MAKSSRKSGGGSSLISYKNYRKLLWLVSLGAPIFFIVACFMALTNKSFLNYLVFGWTSMSFAIMYALGTFAIGMMASKKSGSAELKDDFTTWGIGMLAYAVQGALALFRHHHQTESDYVEDGLPSEVNDYAGNVPMALADARFEAIMFYALAMNTLFCSFWFKQELVNSLWRWMSGGKKSDSSD